MNRVVLTMVVAALSCGVGLAIAAPHAQAQSDAGVPPSDAATADEDDSADEDEDTGDEEDEDWDDEEPQLRPPTLDMGTSSTASSSDDDEDEDDAGDDEDLDDEEDEDDEDASDEDADEDEDDDTLPSPEQVTERLDGAGTDPTVQPWSTPQTTFEMHGYLRFRGEFQDTFFLGRNPSLVGGTDAPFDRFIPTEDVLVTSSIDGGCDGGRSVMSSLGAWSGCTQHALAFANMRFRMEPTIHLSDDVRIHAQIDVFDNMVMGSTPDGYAIDPLVFANGAANTRNGYVPLLALSQTQQSPTYGQNSLIDSIRARRAWAEVRNRGLGEIRFGRMGNHWGLGILANDGRGIDQDFQSDVDRIMAITRILGFYVFGAWDFASEGFLYNDPRDQHHLQFDRSRLDDVDQMVFGVARRSTPEEQAEALQRGDVVLNGGVFFVYRTQNLSTEGTRNPLSAAAPTYVRRGFEVYVPDVWLQFLWGDLRLEVEGVAAIGTIDNTSNTSFDPSTHLNILQGAFAFEGEYHLLNRQLGIYFNAGWASGDSDVEGLNADSLGVQQQGGPRAPDTTTSTFYFNPAYRVDLIFWRNIMRQIGGAYYFRPGVSYDFIRNNFGQLLGARADLVYSRASNPVQTWGNSADLGLEIDAQVYYRSEDGPDLLDGFYASIQYGIFFPFQGLGYLPGQLPPGVSSGGQNAQTLRLILGVQY
ncbi:MAG: TIGR04551 family protein [Sandaracinus sp.]